MSEIRLSLLRIFFFFFIFFFKLFLTSFKTMIFYYWFSRPVIFFYLAPRLTGTTFPDFGISPLFLTFFFLYFLTLNLLLALFRRNFYFWAKFPRAAIQFIFLYFPNLFLNRFKFCFFNFQPRNHVKEKLSNPFLTCVNYETAIGKINFFFSKVKTISNS